MSYIRELFLYSISFSVFSLGMIFNLSWKTGWVIIFSISFILLLSYVHQLINKKIIYDKFLFLLGVTIFILLEPYIFLLQGLGFPSIDGKTIHDNYISNKVGFIVSIYIFFFYAGRISALKIIKPTTVLINSRKEQISLKFLFVFLIISIFPYFMSGGSDLYVNFLMNISGRSSGYVAFSDSGAATQNPVMVLMAQSIPVTIILVSVYASSKKNILKLFAAITALVLLVLFVSLGGRSVVISVFFTLLILWYIRRQGRNFPVIKISIIFFVIFITILYQINTRDKENKKVGDFSRSVMVGTELNRELTFIAGHYGEIDNFIVAHNIFSATILPMVDTLWVLITNPIPRIIWKDKPIDESVGPYNYLRLGATGFGTGVNLTPTVPGRYYMKYGIIGVIEAGIMIGFLWSWSNIYIRIYLNSHVLLLLIPIFSSSILFICIRDFSSGRIYPLLFLILFVYLNRLQVKTKK